MELKEYDFIRLISPDNFVRRCIYLGEEPTTYNTYGRVRWIRCYKFSPAAYDNDFRFGFEMIYNLLGYSCKMGW